MAELLKTSNNKYIPYRFLFCLLIYYTDINILLLWAWHGRSRPLNPYMSLYVLCIEISYTYIFIYTRYRLYVTYIYIYTCFVFLVCFSSRSPSLSLSRSLSLSLSLARSLSLCVHVQAYGARTYSYIYVCSFQCHQQKGFTMHALVCACRNGFEISGRYRAVSVEATSGPSLECREFAEVGTRGGPPVEARFCVIHATTPRSSTT